MNYNLKRHKLLGILSHQKTLSELSEIDDSDDSEHIEKQISYSCILNKINVTNYELNILIKELTENKEIDYYHWNNEEKRGLFATSKGLTSFADKKYFNKNIDIIINWLKSIAQIAIPILALIVAILSLTIKFNTINSQAEKENKRINSTLQIQKLRIEKLEDLIKNPPTCVKTDSL